MARADEMRRLADDIVGAFEARVAGIGAIKAETEGLLKGFHKALAEMATEGRRERLAEVKARVSTVEEMLAEFDKAHAAMSKELRADLEESYQTLLKEGAEGKKQRLAEIRERANTIAKMLDDFDKALAAVAKETREAFAQARSAREKEEAERRKEALADMKARAAEVRGRAEAMARMLDDFDKAHAAMAKELRKELEAAQRALKEEVSSLLAGFSQERQEAAAIWQNLVATMRAKRGVAPPPPPPPPPPPVVEEEVEEVEEEVEEEVPELTIEEQIIEYLEAHPEGVRVGDMEEPLGVPRTRLGVICKRMWDEGEIRRDNNLYYPV